MIKLKDVDPRMISNNLKPSEPVHPGLLLKEEIECRGITQKSLMPDGRIKEVYE